jgi:hypothetical protein
MSLGVRFVRSYLTEYRCGDKVKKATCHKWSKARRGRSLWTKIMRNVLINTAQRIGFNKRPFMELARRDFVFHTNGPPNQRRVMAIEHENDAKDILRHKGEVDKLLISDADLRVLITFVRSNRDLLGRRRSLARRMQRKIEKWVPANRNPEFLLIVGRYRFFDAEYLPKQEPWTMYRWRRRRGRWIANTTLVNDQDWSRLENNLKTGLVSRRSTITRSTEIL